MECPGCRQENPAGVRFCNGCGQPLTLACPACGRENPPASGYCNACGTPLVESSSAQPASPRKDSEAARPAPGGPEGERRQLTVLFCDLVGSTALSERLDPEELRVVIREYQAACAEVIGRFDGHIAQYLGDGLLVYFGYPRAHEDDAQRAVRAGLGVLDRVTQLTVRVGQDAVGLAVRVGIHTGLVVVGEVGGGTRHEQLALGETPNLAARLQALAEPGAVVISGATRRLVQGVFVLRDLGRQALKGVSAPVAVYQVLGESEAQSGLDVPATAGLTPLVGREEEAGLLLARWEQVTEGQGQVVLLSGEPGIGKSRLVQVVKDRVAGSPHRRLECRCSPYYQHTPLYAVLDLLPRLFEWRRDDPPEAKLGKLETGLVEYPLSRADVVPLLASLLSLPPSDRYPLPPMSPERQKRKTLEAVLALVLAMATAHPVLFIVEDLHWIDPTTLELLTLLLDQAPTARLLTLLAARPTFDPPWTPRAHLTSLTLTRFPRRQTELLVSHVAGGKALPAEVAQQIVAKTDGVPLFVEELTKMVLESGLLREQEDHYELTGPLPPLAIPSTLQDSLMARLDRLATVKEVAQLGATLGRAFPYELLRAISPLDDVTLQQALGRLMEAELLYQRGVPPQATYTFKHALIQEAAYQSLLRSTRQQYHQRIAQAVVERFPDVAETRPEFVAHHYTEAGLSLQAVEYWRRAGQRAVARSALAEAAAHYTKGLEVLGALPATPERDARELGLQVALGYALVPVKGWAAPDAAHVFTRADDLCRRVGETPQLFPALWGVWAFYFTQGDQRRAGELADQCLALADRAHDADALIEARYAMAAVAYSTGRLAAARTHCERMLDLYDPARHGVHALLYGQDPKVVALLWLALTLWHLGYPDQALERSREALACGETASHPFSLAWGLTSLCVIRVSRREPEEAVESVQRMLALCEEQAFAYMGAWASISQGANLVQLGQRQEGITHLRQAVEAYRATGADWNMSWPLSLLAEAYLSTRQAPEGLAAVAEGLALVDKNSEHVIEAELHRLKGELLLIQPVSDAAEAETCFRRALAVARHHDQRSWELRAATSLARLWQRQGKRAEARDLLAGVYGWFTEGFDTADLKDAKALLDELA